jgi:DNA primase
MRDQAGEIKAKVDIITILSEYLDLKKSGRNYKALCPFHSEKTPSFMVSQELQIYKCFGCGEGGDVYDFLQKYEGMDFYEALKYLAEKAGVKLKPLAPGRKGEKEKFYEINNQALRFYHYLLTKHKIGKKALSYLVKNRKIEIDSIKTFRLGYSPESPYALKRYLGDKKGVSQDDLVRAGLILIKEGRVFDRFRDRIIFPLYDHRGNVLGFAGRTLPGEKNKDLAKYINSPETPVYHKSDVLYGLNNTKKEIRDEGFAVIVEGELDMISSWQSGVRNVVAIKGSALTQEQVKLLSRFTQKVVLALDADVAGDAASRRGIQIAEKEGFEIKVAKLGKYKDPDDLARSDPEKLQKCIKRSVGIWDFLIDSIFARFGGEGGVQKAKLSKELIPVLSSISDRIVQSHYIQLAAKRLGVSEEAVIRQIEEVGIVSLKQQPKVDTSLVEEKTRTSREMAEERLLAVAFKFDAKVLLAKGMKKLIKTPLAERVLDSFLVFMKKNKEFDPSLFAVELPKELVDGFATMVLKEIGGLEDKPERYLEEIKIIRKNLEIMEIKEKLEKTSKDLKQAETQDDQNKLKRKQEEFNRLSIKLKELGKD